MLNKLKPKSEFSKNVLTLMTGTTIAQAIPIAISPILTRLYTPEDFGVFALYMSIVSLFAIVVTGRYELAIILPKEDSKALLLMIGSIIISFIFSIVLFAIIVLFHKEILTILNNKDIDKWLYFIPFSIFLLALYQNLNYYFNRKKEYSTLSKNKVIQSFSNSSINLVVVYFEKINGLIIGNIISQMMVIIILIKKINYKFINFDLQEVKELFKRYIKFPKFEMFSALFNKASSQMPIILLAIFFGSNIVGFYSLSNRILTLPMALLGNSVGQVFLQSSSKLIDNKVKLSALTKNTFKKLFYIGFIPLGLINIYGDILFSFVFGNNWEIAGIYAQILAIWLFLVFITSPLSTLLITLEKQKESLVFNISIFIARVLSLYAGYYIFNDVLITIGLFTLVGILFWSGLLIYLFKLVDLNRSGLLKYLLIYLVFISILFFIKII